MKINIKNAFMALATVLLLGSCSEGQYWTEPTDKGQVVAFAKAAGSVTVGVNDTAPSSYTVTVYRSQATGELEVPVTLTSSDEAVISGPSSVTFKAGENTAEYVLSIGDIMPGVSYTAKLAVNNGEDPFTHVNTQNLSFTFSISQSLTWTSAGEAAVQSLGWVGNEGAPMNVKVEEGNWPVEGQRLFRLLDVYYTLEPDYAEPGAELRFLTDDEGNALGLFQAWSYIGEYDDSDGYFFFGCPAQYGCEFYNEGNQYVMDGLIGTASSLTGTVSPAYYETIVFTWDCPSK